MAISIALPEFPDHPGLAVVRDSLAPVAARVSDREFARMCADRAEQFWSDYHELNHAYGLRPKNRSAAQAAKIERFEKAGLDAFDLLQCVGWFENCQMALNARSAA
jgi:hypothetical protein